MLARGEGIPEWAGLSYRASLAHNRPLESHKDAAMTLHNKRDLFAGLMFIAFGLVFVIVAQDYSMGTSRRMGPGYFPTILGALQLLLGLVVLVAAFMKVNRDDEPMTQTDWRGLGLIIGSVMLFAQLLPLAGFVVAAPLLLMVASLASPESSWRERIVLTLVLTIGTILVFRVGLEMRFPLLPPALT